MKLRWLFLTLFKSGHSPKAPGTAGTLVALPFGVVILMYMGSQTLLLLSTLITLVAVKAIDAYELQSGIHDNQKIVIDELVGVWIALSVAPGITFGWNEFTQWNNGVALQIALSFIFFRLYDIKKPSLIGRIDREARGGWGVMGDDILAGFAAGISAALVWQILLQAM